MSYLSLAQTCAGAVESLPAAVGAELTLLEARLGQSAGPEAQQRLAELGEAAAARVLRKIGQSRTPVKTLPGFIKFMAEKEKMERNARGIAPTESRACSSGPSRGDESICWPHYHNEDEIDVQSPCREEIAPCFSNHARVEAGSPNGWMPISPQDNGCSVGEISRAVPNLAKMEAKNPYGMILSRNQDDTQNNSPIRAITSAMMPVPTLPWMAGENPSAWISSLNQDYAPALAMAPLVSNQMHVQINSPIRAMAPDVVMQAGSPGHCVSIGLHNHMGIESPMPNIIHAPPRYVSTPSPVRDLSRHVQGMVVPLGSPRSPAWGSMPSPATCRATSNALREKASPQMLALEELEFRKIFMIFAYLSRNKLEDELSVGDIRYLKSLSMVHFESKIWHKFGHKCIEPSDRAKNLDSDPGATSVYHCSVEIRGDSIVTAFKGPYVENTRTHLQKVVGDDNVLVVKFMGESSDKETDTKTYFLPYHKVAEDGIVLGLRRYRFFLYKDGGKEENRKEEKRKQKNKKCTSAVRCYFVRTESGWNMDEPYILSGKTVDQARKLFMHIHTVPTLPKYMARFALLLSKTITLEVDLSAVHVIQLDDKSCSDEHGSIVHRDGDPLIHTDGTGLISEDLARKCPTSVYKGNFLKSQDVAACDKTLMTSPSSKRHRSIATEPPLLMQFRMFYKGSAVKGTALVDRRLPPGTILIRPSMIKVKSDPKLCGVQSVNSSELIKMKNDPILHGVQSVNSLEIVTTSEQGQYSGKVLVYKHPGLHFGDIHVLTARYIEDIEKVVGFSKYAIFFPTSGPRSLADEMANSDFDGDMYWVSINAKLLEQFMPSEPWVQVIKPKKPQQKVPQDFDESHLERQLFHEFLRTRFTPSYALSAAADCWLAYMDRLLTDGVNEDEKKLLEEKMKKLVDLYYLALDAPKTGIKINIPAELMKKDYPHFMERKDGYHSTSILGRIYDEADRAMLLKSEDAGPIKIPLDPRFTEREVSPEQKHLWTCRYTEYLIDSTLLMNLQDKEEKHTKFEELYRKYKHLLYNAAEFEQSPRNHDDVFNEACAIYQIVYEKASTTYTAGNVKKCCFVWNVAGRALCHFYALGSEGDKVLVPMPVAHKLLKKRR